MATARPKRERKTSSKLAFMHAHSESWEKEKEQLDATKGDRKRKRTISTKKRGRGGAKASTGTKKKITRRGTGKNGKIKKPLSAYMFFAKETRKEVIEEFPQANFGEVAQILGEWWQDCSAKEKKRYENMHAEDKVRYAIEIGEDPPAKVTSSKQRKPTAKAKAAKSKPTYFDMCKEAIMALKNRKGSSAQAIEKYILANIMDEESFKKFHMRNALKSGAAKGNFIKVKGSFKVSPEEKARRC